jgi:hypothetical protein
LNADRSTHSSPLSRIRFLANKSSKFGVRSSFLLLGRVFESPEIIFVAFRLYDLGEIVFEIRSPDLTDFVVVTTNLELFISRGNQSAMEQTFAGNMNGF